MELLQLRYFIKSCETQNFTYTAQYFSVPASDVSQSVHRLEKEIGMELFTRQANRIFLNENGRLLYERISGSLGEIDRAFKELAEKNSKAEHTLKILALCHRDLASACIETLHTTFPQARVMMNIGRDRLAKKDYDIIIGNGMDPISPDFDQRYLLEEDFLVAVSSDSPYASQSCLRRDQLKQAEYVSLANSGGFDYAFNSLEKYIGVPPTITYESDDMYYICKYVEEGTVISLFPSISWRHRISGKIRLLPIEDYRIIRTTSLSISKKKKSNSLVRAFEEIIQQKVDRLRG